ncbi:MAG: ABC transporter permease [Sulfolobales archaeon]
MKSLGRVLALSIVTIYLIFLYLPIVVSILGSFSPRRFIIDLYNPTFRWFIEAFSDKVIISATTNSIQLSIASSVISSLTGFLVGYAYVMRKPRGFIDTIIYVPIIIPEIIEAFTLAIFYITLNIEMGFVTVLLGHLTFNIAYAFVIIRSRIDLIPKEIINVARVMGAGEFYILSRIVMPLTIPAILSAVFLTFALSFDDLIKTLFTSGPGFKTLPVLIWSMVGRGGISPEINAVTTVILLISLSISLVLTYTIRKDLSKMS